MGKCVGENQGGWKLLTEKVKVAPSEHLYILDEPLLANNSTKRSKILCAIYTTASKTATIRSIGQTWGWRCDGFFAASTSTNETIGAIDLPHYGNETYNNMWQKTRSILAYIHDYYLQDYDFFYLAGDDAHLIVENLRMVLSSLGTDAIEYPLFLGGWFPDPLRKRRYFVGGGGGYVLNKRTLQLLVGNCMERYLPFLQISAEDRMVTNCLRSIQVYPNSSVDVTGAQRFHSRDPNFVATFHGSDKKVDRFFNQAYQFWGDQWGWKSGYNVTSSSSVSFHGLKSATDMMRHHAILYKSCPIGTNLGNALQQSIDDPQPAANAMQINLGS
jgi:hypothetical protein